jgi:hypothetical protein
MKKIPPPHYPIVERRSCAAIRNKASARPAWLSQMIQKSGEFFPAD